MARKSNHKADIKNPNKGTDGVNKTYSKSQGNRGKQKNPTWYKSHPEHRPKNDNNR